MSVLGEFLQIIMGGNKLEKTVVVKRLSLLLTVIASLVSLQCAINPVTKQYEFMLISTEQEVAYGRDAAPEITEKYGYYDDQKIQGYISRIGEKLVSVCDRKDIAYHFTVVDSPEINAFALPGGYVYITRGILSQINSEAELASIMGHELGHVTARHSARQISSSMSYQTVASVASMIYPQIQQWSQVMDTIFSGIENGYGRSYELQADDLGIKYSSNAGYNPRASASFLQHLEMNEKGENVLHGLMSTHPETVERIDKAKAEAELILKQTPGKQFVDNRDPYLSQIDGLVYGLGEKNGIFDGHTYNNGFYKFSVSIPQGWKKFESRYVFAFKQPEREMYATLQRINLKNNITAEQLAQKWENNKKLKRVYGKNSTTGSINAFRALYSANVNKAKATLDVLFFVRQGTGFAILTSALDSEYKQGSIYFNNIFNSLRELSEKEASLFGSRTIKIYTVKSGDTVQSLAENYFRDKTKDEEIALINGFDKNRKLTAGEKIKIPMLKGGTSIGF